jgi:hypothetical protein
MCLLVIARELWWMNQEWLELWWGHTVDQKWSQCKGRLVRSPRNSNSAFNFMFFDCNKCYTTNSIDLYISQTLSCMLLDLLIMSLFALTHISWTFFRQIKFVLRLHIFVYTGTSFSEGTTHTLFEKSNKILFSFLVSRSCSAPNETGTTHFDLVSHLIPITEVSWIGF